MDGRSPARGRGIARAFVRLQRHQQQAPGLGAGGGAGPAHHHRAPLRRAPLVQLFQRRAAPACQRRRHRRPAV